MNIPRSLPIALLAIAAVSHGATKTKPAPAAAPAVVAPAAAPAPAVAAPVASKFASDQVKFSYVVGLDVGESLKQADYSFDMDMLFKGMSDMLSGDSTKVLLTPEERREAIQQLTQQLQKAREIKDSIVGAESEAKAKAFFDKNKKVKGVITTASGLQYTYIQKGKGASPKAGEEVTAHYAGSLLDGTEFDSSIKRGEPATFSLANVIPGWQEMLPLMKVGDKVKCWIPSELGYGKRGNAKIPPNSLLIFEIELVALPAAQLTAPAAASAAPATPATPATAPATTAKPAKK